MYKQDGITIYYLQDNNRSEKENKFQCWKTYIR